MVSFSVSIFILSLVASGLSVSLTHSKYDNITVNDDVHNLLTKLLTSQQDIGNAINGFSSPGGTLTQALVSCSPDVIIRSLYNVGRLSTRLQSSQLLLSKRALLFWR